MLVGFLSGLLDLLGGGALSLVLLALAKDWLLGGLLALTSGALPTPEEQQRAKRADAEIRSRRAHGELAPGELVAIYDEHGVQDRGCLRLFGPALVGMAISLVLVIGIWVTVVDWRGVSLAGLLLSEPSVPHGLGLLAAGLALSAWRARHRQDRRWRPELLLTAVTAAILAPLYLLCPAGLLLYWAVVYASGALRDGIAGLLGRRRSASLLTRGPTL